LYYTDPYLVSFDATVTEHLDLGGRPAVVLDRTAFYPTSGGQPFDVGALGEAVVSDVVDLEDGRIAHVVDRAIEPAAVVVGRIDWTRRFDHMQQHTGQHLLSAAFEHVHGARTESFHLGSESSTIDFAVPLDARQVTAAEAEANRVLWEDREVHVRFVDADEAASLPLRKESVRTGTLRLVEIAGYDLSACGGTHVGRTGAIGVVAIAGHERFKGGTRVEFLCGGRALRAFAASRDVIAASVRHLSVLPAELPAGIERLQAEGKEQRAVTRDLRARLVRHEAAALAATAIRAGEVQLAAQRVEGFDALGLKGLAQEIAARPGHAAVLLGADSPASLVVARAGDVALDAGAIVRQLTARFGGKGGGRPELAQGGGITGAPETVIAAARELVAGQAQSPTPSRA
jgi:alanyl-tRNA synthetase